MSMTWLARVISPMPAPRPSSAVTIGRPMALNDPKLISRITIAARDPDDRREAERCLLGLLDRLATELDFEGRRACRLGGR